MAAYGTSMRVQIQLRIIADDDSVISEDEILQLDKGDDRLEAIGLSLGEAKAVLAGAQERVVTAQAHARLWEMIRPLRREPRPGCRWRPWQGTMW
jgi:hypothetical protein